MDAGKYFVKLINEEGRPVKTIQLIHPGGNALKEISTGKRLTKGICYLEILKPAGEKYFMSVIVE